MAEIETIEIINNNTEIIEDSNIAIIEDSSNATGLNNSVIDRRTLRKGIKQK